MKLKSQLLFILASILLLAGRCSKDKLPPAVLPSATQEGKNTIGFTINGEVWVPYYKCGFGKDPCGEYSARYSTPFAAPNSIDFDFERERSNTSSALTITGPFSTITTIGNKVDSILVHFTAENSNGNNGEFGGPRPGSTFIITKIDQQSQIISGEFEFILLEQNSSGNQITLKNGRFDFKFNACKCSN